MAVLVFRKEFRFERLGGLGRQVLMKGSAFEGILRSSTTRVTSNENTGAVIDFFKFNKMKINTTGREYSVIAVQHAPKNDSGCCPNKTRVRPPNIYPPPVPKLLLVTPRVALPSWALHIPRHLDVTEGNSRIVVVLGPP